jgi:acyl-CoA thioesterase FadM
VNRIKVDLPAQFQFQCEIPVRITDVNYGGHVGNDTILTLIHEARMQFLRSAGYTEMEFGGNGMIMADAAIEFKNELFYGDTVIISVATGSISRIGFDLCYKLEKKQGDKMVWVASAKTGMICYDYDRKKIVPVSQETMLSLLEPQTLPAGRQGHEDTKKH